jgi:hypothetical protein
MLVSNKASFLLFDKLLLEQDYGVHRQCTLLTCLPALSGSTAAHSCMFARKLGLPTQRAAQIHPKPPCRVAFSCISNAGHHHTAQSMTLPVHGAPLQLELGVPEKS